MFTVLCWFLVLGVAGLTFPCSVFVVCGFWYAFVPFLTWMGSVLSGLGVPFGCWGVLLALMRDPPSPLFILCFSSPFY